MQYEDKIEILDCSIRDGGYNNNWRFSKKLVRESYRALSKSGVDFVELGFRGSSKYFATDKYGIWRFSNEGDLRQITYNINGAKIALMGDYGKIDLEDFVNKKESCVDLIRIAVHKDKIYKAIDFLEEIKKKGYLTSLQCMGYSTYNDLEKRDLFEALKLTELDYIYVADSYGSIYPFQIKKIFQPFLELGSFKVGFHPHNNIQMAFANTLEAIQVGVDIIDTTIYGMGRGAGNLPTEILLSYLSVRGAERYNVIPILNCVDNFFLDLKKETPWGYQLPYMISGIFNSHPSYSKDMLKRKEYSMEDIWKALECIQSVKPIGFDASLVDNLIKHGFVFPRHQEELRVSGQQSEKKESFVVQSVPYLNRHQGREFLVLANGPNLKRYKQDIDIFIKKYKPVVIGANFLNGLFVPDYHAFNNIKRFTTYVDTVDSISRLLIGTNIPEDLISEYVADTYEPLVFRDILGADFDIQDGVIMSNCRTISVLLIGVALVMGAKRVFVAGMDGYKQDHSVASTLFYDEKFDPREHEINLERHKWNEKFLFQLDEYIQKKGGEGIHIITPTTHSLFYKSISNYRS